jgi:hypothetical protein
MNEEEEKKAQIKLEITELAKIVRIPKSVVAKAIARVDQESMLSYEGCRDSELADLMIDLARLN